MCGIGPVAEKKRRAPDVYELMERRKRGDLREPSEDVIDEEEPA